MVDVGSSNPRDLAAGLDLRGVGGAAGSPLVAPDGVRVDVGHGAVGLEVSRLADRRPGRRAGQVRERVYKAGFVRPYAQ